VTESPGLYFLGLPWMHTRGSALLGWVGQDAEYIAGRIGAFRPATRVPAPASTTAGAVRARQRTT
jgi:putative flavoprotein involved in K+ transport